MINKFFNYVKKTIYEERKKQIEKEVDDEIKAKEKRIRDNEKELQKFVDGDLSKEEMIELTKKLKGEK